MSPRRRIDPESTDEKAPEVPYHQIRATYTPSTIIVYQAYNDGIASAALEAQSFKVPNFSPTRMTWIKPSFQWMLYRCGWGQKTNQERVLAIHLTREGWEQALKWSGSKEDGKCVRVQWDPERGMKFEGLAWRSIQVGLSGEAVSDGLLGGWVVKIEDYTEKAKRIGELVAEDKVEEAKALLPDEVVYEFLDESARTACGAS